jgi:hypothetical protein
MTWRNGTDGARDMLPSRRGRLHGTATAHGAPGRAVRVSSSYAACAPDARRSGVGAAVSDTTRDNLYCSSWLQL